MATIKTQIANSINAANAAVQAANEATQAVNAVAQTASAASTAATAAANAAKEAKEAAQQHYQFALNWYAGRLTQPRFGGTELRNQGWTIVGLLDLYRAFGDPAYKTLALAIGKNDLLYGEQLAGGHGVWEGPDASPPTASMSNTMYMYVA